MIPPIQNSILKTVGQLIRDTRTERKITQAELAKRLGVSIPAISKIESGVTDVNLSRVHQIAEVLEIDVLILLGSQPKNSDNDAILVAQKQLAIRDEEIVMLHRKVTHLYEELNKK
ncbi:helix-turn-helix domain-containing protein [Mucilaginibacter pedocola]|uniref:helix-turn-helix domain-containing protein n=1 Tax=Mucilaginibacter pedocola TaxID=1792845 RepID=UPI001EE426A9|nr:helix-turn-helix transcriptional regulator [Mucilaginibacter pedocola]